jgi:superfamily II DNA helicase RecQ
VDKAHISLVVKGYCKRLKHICDVRSEPVPLILLSATLPPSFIVHISTTYLLLSDTVMFRQCTNHPELKYVLEKMNKGSDLSQCAMQIMQGQQGTWIEQDRSLVFVPSMDMCMELAHSSGWHAYGGHKETMDDEDRQRAYNTWREGQDSRVMITTSTFSTGNDYPHMHLVLHMDKPFEMLEYIEAQGRAG